MPVELWGPLGVVAGALITGLTAWVVAWVRERRTARSDAGTLALQMVRDLTARVEALEHDRNAYRSWSHVLWWHIHDETVPRIPAPAWPDELAR